MFIMLCKLLSGYDSNDEDDQLKSVEPNAIPGAVTPDLFTDYDLEG